MKNKKKMKGYEKYKTISRFLASLREYNSSMLD
jgi:hypothetical protein